MMSNKVLLFLCVFFSLFSDEEYLKRTTIKYAEDQHFFLTCPKSGTTMLACYVMGLVNKPCYSLFGNRLYNHLRLDLDYSKTYLYHTHTASDLKRVNSKKNKLLFILRNYKECMGRNTKRPQYIHKFGTEDAFISIFQDKNFIYLKTYIANLMTFHDWDPDNRLIVYYEDLIENPKKEMERVLIFFKEPILNDIDSQVLEDIRCKSLTFYQKKHGSITKGKNLSHYSDALSDEAIVQIDESMKNSYPDLWKNYLSRYEGRL